MTERGILEKLHQTGLSQIAIPYQLLLKPAIRLATEPADEAALPIGTSKFGGHPDLPASLGWPERDGMPLYFLGQVALEEVNGLDTERLLPKEGMLYFFFDVMGQPWGDPSDLGGWVVLFSPPDSEPLKRFESPSGLPAPYDDMPRNYFNTCKILFESALSFPGWNSEEVESLLKTEEDRKKIWEAIYEDDIDHYKVSGPAYQLLGHPHLIQNPMEEECQYSSHGIYCGTQEGYDEGVRRGLKEGVQDWILLLQIDSDDNVGWMWGDAGMLYFWIRKQDLEARDFSKTWVILQCY